jgi:hypothetical protein
MHEVRRKIFLFGGTTQSPRAATFYHSQCLSQRINVYSFGETNPSLSWRRGLHPSPKSSTMNSKHYSWYPVGLISERVPSFLPFSHSPVIHRVRTCVCLMVMVSHPCLQVRTQLRLITQIFALLCEIFFCVRMDGPHGRSPRKASIPQRS